MNAPAPMGHNNPPADPLDAITIHVDGLFETAQGFLNGDPIASEEEAADVAKLIADARQIKTDAEAMRKAEAKPFDDGKAAVQARWTPITDEKKGRCALIIQTALKVQTAWLAKVEAKKTEAARLLRVAAEEAQAKAIELQRAADATNLDARAAADAAIDEAAKANRLANRAENDKAHAKGGEGRAIGLVSVWSAEITDRRAALNHYVQRNPDDFVSLLQSLADHEARHGPRNAPGVTFTEERVAR